MWVDLLLQIQAALPASFLSLPGEVFWPSVLTTFVALVTAGMVVGVPR